jgi:formylglycine-generating enzyme required for sulfatase activity
MFGNVSEWCGDASAGGDRDLRVARGASWSTFAARATPRLRETWKHDFAFVSIGIRVARDGS